jgi:hypothetical protein
MSAFTENDSVPTFLGSAKAWPPASPAATTEAEIKT